MMMIQDLVLTHQQGSTMTKTLTEAIAATLSARTNCIVNSTVWQDRHEKTIKRLEQTLPSGAGFDRGTQIDLDRSTSHKIIFNTSFHHMNGDGIYCEWSKHTVIVTPSFLGRFDVRVTGRNVRDIKDYIAETFYQVLGEQAPEC
jgi:hypothetical protein